MNIAIIGGGAAGYFAAIKCAETNRRNKVVLFEATRHPLYKVEISGGGRCNVTHNCFDPDELVKGYPRGHREMIGPLRQFQPQDTVRWFETRGVKLKSEEDGRMFPFSDDSASIISCLQNSAQKSGVEVRIHSRVVGIKRIAIDDERSVFELSFKEGGTEQFDRVLLATGDSPNGYRIAASLGHTIIPCVPSLFTFKISDSRLDGLEGISVPQARLRLSTDDSHALEQHGPLLITHWGLSGPAVLKLSAWGARILFISHYHAELTVDWLDDRTPESLIEEFQVYRNEHPKRAVAANNFLPIPKRWWNRIVNICGVSDDITWSHLTRESMLQIAEQLTRGQYQVTGRGEFKDEFVTCGGVKLKEIDFQTMESRLCRGLHFAGEVLDIDGITGGYNFQAAWTTGWIAGKSLAAT